jgi:hypothetical protein
MIWSVPDIERGRAEQHEAEQFCDLCDGGCSCGAGLVCVEKYTSATERGSADFDGENEEGAPELIAAETEI